MDKSQELLKKFSSTDAKYFELHNGVEKQVQFLFVEEAPPNTNGWKGKLMRYYFNENGKEKFFDRASKQLMREMGKVSEGDFILIKRMGEDKFTTYSIIKNQ